MESQHSDSSYELAGKFVEQEQLANYIRHVHCTYESKNEVLQFCAVK